MGGFCLVVDFHRRWSATNKATPSSLTNKLNSTVLSSKLFLMIFSTSFFPAKKNWVQEQKSFWQGLVANVAGHVFQCCGSNAY